jgi:hypothetical protein
MGSLSAASRQSKRSLLRNGLKIMRTWQVFCFGSVCGTGDKAGEFELVIGLIFLGIVRSIEGTNATTPIGLL